MSTALDDVLARLDHGLDDSLARLFALLRIPSVSTDPAYDRACTAAAAWLVETLSGLGFAASVRPTVGKPMVVAHWPAPDAGAPAATAPNGAGRVLFYGHYDVQPPDPLELWDTPPFEPRIEVAEDGSRRIVARGASDDKGQLMTFVEACRAWLAATGSLPVPVTILFEGEEETGSPSLPAFLAAHREELKAEVALVCDTSMWEPGVPAITTTLRGLVAEEVTITGPDRDLHSGLYGGAAINPIRVLTRILGALHDDRGRVCMPGFYDGVAPVPDAVQRQWDGLGFDLAGFLGGVGLSRPAGEDGVPALNQLWARPTCDINGICGGYTGTGAKTVIPREAFAKVSFRLVGGQDPAAVRDAFHRFVRDRLPGDCVARFENHAASPAIVLATETAQMAATRAALASEFGTDPVLMGCGGSIPIVGQFKRDLGIDSLLVGFALDDDRVHSPNEKYDVASFRHGARSWARVLAALGARG